jgi:hypothetical protein
MRAACTARATRGRADACGVECAPRHPLTRIAQCIAVPPLRLFLPLFDMSAYQHCPLFNLTFSRTCARETIRAEAVASNLG